MLGDAPRKVLRTHALTLRCATCSPLSAKLLAVANSCKITLSAVRRNFSQLYTVHSDVFLLNRVYYNDAHVYIFSAARINFTMPYSVYTHPDALVFICFFSLFLLVTSLLVACCVHLSEMKDNVCVLTKFTCCTAACYTNVFCTLLYMCMQQGRLTSNLTILRINNIIVFLAN